MSMDKAAAPQTFVKVPFGGRTIRSRPLESRHVVALSMTKQLKSTSSRLDILFGIMLDVMGAEEYARVASDLITGDVTERQVMEVLTALGAATRAVEDARNTPPAAPDDLAAGE